MTIDTATEITGLQSGITHCQTMGEYFAAAVAAQEVDAAHYKTMQDALNERASAARAAFLQLRAVNVSGEACAALSAAEQNAIAAHRQYFDAWYEIVGARESLQQAQQAYEAAEEALRSHTTVAEAYNATDGAGDREFVTETSTQEPTITTDHNHEGNHSEHPVQLPEEAQQLQCRQCGAPLVQKDTLQLEPDTSEALATLYCSNLACGQMSGAWTWKLSPAEYRAAAEFQAATNPQVVDEGPEEELVDEEDDNTCDCDDVTCSYDHPDGQDQYESWWKGHKDDTLENHANAEWVVADLTDAIYGRYPKAWQIRRGSVIVRDRFTGEKWDALAFLAQHSDLQQRYLEQGLHAFWPDEYPPGLGYVPNPNWAD